MAKSVLNLQTKQNRSANETGGMSETRERRCFVSLGGMAKRMILANEIILVRGGADAHAEVLLRSNERVPTTREASEIARGVSDLLGESMIGCGGRTGFYPDTTFFRPEAITGFEVVDESSVMAWFATPVPQLLPLSADKLHELLAEKFTLSVLDLKRDRSRQPTVNPADVYMGDTVQRLYDRANGVNNEFHPSYKSVAEPHDE